jgi:hypothetical protein
VFFVFFSTACWVGLVLALIMFICRCLVFSSCISSYKFCTVSSGILYHSPWRASSSYFRDVEGRNVFLTLVSKTDRSGDCDGQGRWRNSPSCSSNHDWTVPAVWIGHYRLGELHRCSEITFDHGMHLIAQLSTYSLAVIRPWRVIMGPTDSYSTHQLKFFQYSQHKFYSPIS